MNEIIYCDCRSSIDMEYLIYCRNLVTYWFVDQYLRSVEYQRLATQHRINYLVRRLGL